MMNLKIYERLKLWLCNTTRVNHFPCPVGARRQCTPRPFSNTSVRVKSLAKNNELVLTANELLNIKIVTSEQKVKLKVEDELHTSFEKYDKVNVMTKAKSAKKDTEEQVQKVSKEEKIGALLAKEMNVHENSLNSDNGKNSVSRELVDRGSITETNSYTDFYQGILDTYKRFSNRPDGTYIVLTHVGSFYELYFEQADAFSNMLGLTLTKKHLKMGPVSFSGFPDRMLEKYMDIIYKAGFKAVICKQVLDSVTNTISRPVDRIMTPGIVTDETCRDFHKNNYLLSISFPEDMDKDVDSKKLGVAWCDINLGLFYVLELEFSQLLSTITRINPSEILVSAKVDIERVLDGSILPELTEMKSYYITKYNQSSKRKTLDDFLWRFADNARLTSLTLDKLSQKEKSATSLLLHYLEICLPNYKTSFQLPSRSLPKTLMQIDSRAAQDLELLETLQSRKRVGALSHLIDKTVTSPGARMLNTWLLAPSTDLEEIKKRHGLLGIFIKDTYFLDTLNQYLKKTADINRIIRRIENNKAEKIEYLELAITIETLKSIFELIKRTFDKKALRLIEPIFEKFIKSKKIHNISKKIQKTIDSKVSYLKAGSNKNEGDVIREFWEIKDTASNSLKKMREEYRNLVQQSEDFKRELKELFQSEGYSGSVKLIKDLKTYDYVVELKSSSKIIPTLVKNLNLNVKERSKSVTKLIDPRWTNIGDRLIKLEYNILLEEGMIINDLNSKIHKLHKELRQISPIVELLDVIQSFTHLALQYNLTKPEMDYSHNFDIKNGRHIVVEEGLKNRIDVINFTVNDCKLKSCEAWVITGPNMGGKSTFLRQNALIVIMAQIGSYVPAERAHIGIIDKIFTRVGSSDNIFKHQSTFMVEMNEAAIILREATSKSLVIVDELGRGTSTNEGVSIAYATLSRLLNVNNSKVLFATHFGPELVDLIESDHNLQESISFYRTSLSEEFDGDTGSTSIEQKIVFDHKLKKGVSFHSHALKIAELAGFPKDALKIAGDSFKKLNKNK